MSESPSTVEEMFSPHVNEALKRYKRLGPSESQKQKNIQKMILFAAQNSVSLSENKSAPDAQDPSPKINEEPALQADASTPLSAGSGALGGVSGKVISVSVLALLGLGGAGRFLFSLTSLKAQTPSEPIAILQEAPKPSVEASALQERREPLPAVSSLPVVDPVNTNHTDALLKTHQGVSEKSPTQKKEAPSPASEKEPLQNSFLAPKDDENKRTLVSEEIQSIRAIRESVGKGYAALAQNQIETHRHLFPKSTFVEELEYLEIRALYSKNEASGVRSKADAFLKKYPQSAYAEKIKKLAGI